MFFSSLDELGEYVDGNKEGFMKEDVVRVGDEEKAAWVWLCELYESRLMERRAETTDPSEYYLLMQVFYRWRLSTTGERVRAHIPRHPSAGDLSRIKDLLSKH